MDHGIAPQCFTRSLWETRDNLDLEDIEFLNLPRSIFGTGSDTTISSILTFLLAAVAFPEFVRKAQEELDAVVGRERSPAWSDEPNRPYVRAVVKETFRWRPLTVLGGQPHATTEDNTYSGYFIPKGTTLLGNLWGIHLNKHQFRDPHQSPRALFE